MAAASVERAQAPPLSGDQLLEMYRQMWRIRFFEQAVVDLYKQGLVRGSAHPYSGMEAVAVGACAAIRDTDLITSTHRGHGHGLAKGLDPRLMMAEILGKAAGYCKGKGGSMHVTSPSHGMLGADGVVAGSTAIAAGAAFGARLLGHEAVVLCFFGDGAANQGVLFESLNLASVLRLPVIYICENNLWALSTPTSTSTGVPDVAARADGFGMPGRIVDGQDALAVYDAVHQATARARAGGGPSLLECKTYRFHSHSAFATREPRPPDEIAAWKARDPIRLLAERLTRAASASEAQLAEAEERERRLVDEAVDFAKNAPDPDPSEAFDDVYASGNGSASRAAAGARIGE